MTSEPPSAANPHGPDDRETSPLSPSAALPGLPRAADDPYFIPKRIGPYRVASEIGRGGMGSVLLAHRDDDTLKKRVAIKLVKRGMDTDELLRRFQLERQLLSSLNHPNIARVLDAGATEDHRPYFVMEYIEGRPITDYCDSQQLSTTERLEIFQKVCSAVHAAHQSLIVHRDIKPSNILVTTDGEPKLLDFGIAKLINPDLFGSPMATLPEARLMTPEYASPEQVQGQPITTASDIYSLGVLLYELLTGHAPYHFKTRLQEEIVRVVCEVEPERPSAAVTHSAEVTTSDGTTRTVSPEEVAKARDEAPVRLKRRLSGDLDNVVLMAMRKAPRRRYQSAEALAKDLDNHLSGRTVMARPETPGYVFSKFVRRNTWGVAAVVSIIALLMGGVIATTIQRNRALDAEAAERDSRVVAEQARADAEKARAAAERRLDDIRTLTGELVTETQKTISKVEGSTASRVLLITTAIGGLERIGAVFSQEAKEDAALKELLAEAYHAFGELLGGSRGTNTGDFREAHDMYRKAIDLLASVGPDDGGPDRANKWAQWHIELAQTHRKLGELTEALTVCDVAVGAARQAVLAAPGDVAPARLLYTALQTRADMVKDQSGYAAALPGYEESYRARTQLAEKFPGDAKVQRDLAIGLLRLADARLNLDQSDQARKDAIESLRIRQRLLDAEPKNTSYRRDVAVTREYIGNMVADGGDPKVGEEHLLAARQLVRELSEADPLDKRSREDVRRITGSLSVIAYQLGNPQRARDEYRSSLAIAESQIEATPVDQTLILLSETDESVGDAARAAADLRAAADCYRRAIDLLARLENPSDRSRLRSDELRKKLEQILADSQVSTPVATPGGG